MERECEESDPPATSAIRRYMRTDVNSRHDTSGSSAWSGERQQRRDDRKTVRLHGVAIDNKDETIVSRFDCMKWRKFDKDQR